MEKHRYPFIAFVIQVPLYNYRYPLSIIVISNYRSGHLGNRQKNGLLKIVKKKW